MDDDFGALMALLLVPVVPALLVFTIAMMIRARRGKFQRQRITKRRSRSS
jgi:uncharacterized paraquat-inducible protein A